MNSALDASRAPLPPKRTGRRGSLSGRGSALCPATVCAQTDRHRRRMRAGLAGFGYVEDRNLTIEYCYADDVVERIPELAAELVKLPVSMIIAQGSAVQIVADLKLPVPVAYVLSADPVSAGLADSLAQPRGNMTGLTFMAAEFNAKRIELLNELIPNLKHVALLGHPEHAGEHFERAHAQEAADRLGIAITYYPTRTRADLDSALAAIDATRPQAISVFSDGFAIQNGRTMIEFATRHGIPVIAGWAIFAEYGALCTYGPKLSESYRRLAYYVDRILRGARPEEIPIERPTYFELVVNLRAARALNMTVPAALVARTDEVIE